MNYRMIMYILGSIMKVEAGTLVIPIILALIYSENALSGFLITAILVLFIGLALTFKVPKNKIIYAKEGFVVVALSWIVMSIFGALPLYIGKVVPTFVDAFFEIVSGFTTTGSTILTDIEIVPKSILFWRSFTHWIGGMGVLVFILAIIPLAEGRSIHIMKAEVPGPIVGKLVPKVKQTAIILYGIYIVLTIILVVLLVLGGMPLFDSFIHAFGTAGTGGFSSKNISIAYYNSAYIQWVITIFMILFGINFNIYYLLLIRKIKSAFKNEELYYYLGIIVVSSAIIAFNIYPIYKNVSDSIRISSFQVASIITTTGYSTVDFNLWPVFSKTILVMLMFFGASAGSTGGGIKIARIVLLVKIVVKEVRKMVNPRYVSTIKLDGRPVDKETTNGVTTYFTIYMLILLFSVLVVSIDGYSFETNVTSVITCINNVGPGLDVVGPLGNFSQFSALSKLILSLDMLIGRLEIFPILLLLTPSIWKRR